MGGASGGWSVRWVERYNPPASEKKQRLSPGGDIAAEKPLKYGSFLVVWILP